MSGSITPQNPSPIPDEEEHKPDLPLTMMASVVLTQLPLDATAALQEAGGFEKPKVNVRFKAVGSAPILKQQVYKISATQRFEAVVIFLRKVLKVRREDSVFLYVNSTFAPSMDEVVGNLHRVSASMRLKWTELETREMVANELQCFRNQTDDQLVVAYSLTPAFG